MKISVSVLCLSVVCCLVMSCGSTTHEPDHDTRGSRIVYFNSFESARDLEGWNGVFEEMLVSDPAPKGGSKSLDIVGGCVQPTAWIVLPPQPTDATYRLKCWGKLRDRSQPGAVILAINTGGEHRRETALLVDSEEWGHHTSEGVLYCPGKHELRIEIIIGGIVPAGMKIDLIEIERIR